MKILTRFELDVEALHRDYGQRYGRRTGRTVEAIVNALQMAELSDQPVLFISFDMNRADHVARLMMEVGHSMGYEMSRIQRYVVGNGVGWIHFKSTQMRGVDRGWQEDQIMRDVEEE